MTRAWTLIVACCVGSASLAQDAAPQEERSVARSVQAAEARRLRDFERALNGVRFRHFDAPALDGRRALGLAKIERLLRAEPDPRKYPLAWEVFARTDDEARATLIDAFATGDTDAGWTMLGWIACFEDGPLGDHAMALLAAHRERVRWLGGIAEIADHAILSQHPLYAQRGSLLAESTELLGAVPAMIVGQIWPPNARSMEEGVSDRILVRPEREPPPRFEDLLGARAMRTHSIEAEYAGSGVIEVQRRQVGRYMPRDHAQPRFDRQRVFHRGGTHESLIRLTTQAWGRPTDYLGWDVAVWQRWHVEEFQPLVAKRRAAALSRLPVWPTP